MLAALSATLLACLHIDTAAPPCHCLQFSAHEVRRVVPNPDAATLRVSQLHLEDSGVAELQLAAGGEGFSGSTQIVLVAGLPAAAVGRQQVDLSGRYAVNPSGCGRLTRAGTHFRIKLPKRPAAAAAAAIQGAVLRGLVTVRWVPGCSACWDVSA